MIDFLITYLGYPDSGAKKKKYIDPERQQKRLLRQAESRTQTKRGQLPAPKRLLANCSLKLETS